MCVKKGRGHVLLTLFLTFLKIGAFTFGGGYAMIALLRREFVEKKAWMTEEEFVDLVAVAESTPGPIAINSATYIGYRSGKFFGALFSTIAVCLPSFVIIYVISLFLDTFLSWEIVSYAFRGIRVCVVFLILSAGIKMIRGLKKGPMEWIILIVTTTLMVVLSLFAVRFSSIFYILISGALGLFVFLIGRWKGGSAK